MRLRTAALLLVVPALAACGKKDGDRAVAPAPAPAAPTASAPETAPPAPAPETKTPASPAPNAEGKPSSIGEAAAEGTDPGERLPQFTVAGSSGGKAVTVDSRAPGKVTVYCVGSTTCPYTQKYAGKMAEIEKAYAGKDVQFVWLYSNRKESDAEKTSWHKEKGLAGVFVIDKDAVVAKTLAAKKTPEMVVTKADGTITYRGAIDDGEGEPSRAGNEYLRTAIDATLAGTDVPVDETTPAG